MAKNQKKRAAAPYIFRQGPAFSTAYMYREVVLTHKWQDKCAAKKGKNSCTSGFQPILFII